MVKRLRFQENRKDPRGKRRPPHERWVLEPADIALIAIAGAAVLWLQSFAPVLPG
jgi:hypothetical protein